MNAYDKLVAGISEYGITCINEGAFVDQPLLYKDFSERRKQQFAAVLAELGKYRDHLKEVKNDN